MKTPPLNRAMGSKSWSGVAAAGVGAFAGHHVAKNLGGKPELENRLAKHGPTEAPIFGFRTQSIVSGTQSVGNALAQSTASALANAATRSVLEGSSFGDNVAAAIPDVVSQAVGAALNRYCFPPGR